MKITIAVLAGDGIGPEIMRAALEVLRAVEKKFSHEFAFREALIGGAAFERSGEHFPGETLEVCRASEAILFGSVGGPIDKAHEPKWKNCEANSILALRKAFQFYANLRPIKIYPELESASPLKPSVIGRGIDILFVRELCGDIYFGEHSEFKRGELRAARDVAEYDEGQVSAIAEAAFKAASARSKKLTSVDKANVLQTSKLWRAVMHETARRYPAVEYSDMLVDNCAMQLIKNPGQFDVIVTSNLFGDILSDAGAVLPGSLGLTPSASLNPEGFGMYEPSGGSAPDIAGTGTANPAAQILSAALMLRFSFGLEREAAAMEGALARAIKAGARTADIAGPAEKPLSTAQFTEQVISNL